MPRSEVGRNVRVLREGLMWTQGDLAREAGVSPTTVSGIENGRISRPHFGTVRKLARALDTPPEGLLAGPGPAEGGASGLSLDWARSAREEEFESGLEGATLENLGELARELDEEHERLRALYGALPAGSEQRRYVKRQIRDVSARSGSVNASMEFHRDSEREPARRPSEDA